MAWRMCLAYRCSAFVRRCPPSFDWALPILFLASFTVGRRRSSYDRPSLFVGGITHPTPPDDVTVLAATVKFNCAGIDGA